MKIERITPFLVGRSLLVRVYTDQGIVGNGEAGLWAHHRLVYEALRDLSEYYVGKDPGRMEHHFQVVSRNTHFAGAVLSAAMSALDIAMWDILAKSVDKPIYALLGGKCRDKVKVFANVGGNTLDERAASAVRNVERGFTSLRTTPFFSDAPRKDSSKVIKEAVQIVAAIRDAVGDEIDLGLEIHRNLMPDEAIILAHELAPYRILYYEDPLAPESIEALEYVARHVDLPIATGERFYSIQQFKELIDKKTVAMIRPDLSLAGGYTQCKKIAGLAEASFVGVFPHLMGSPVNIAAFVQFDAAIPNFRLHESNMVDNHPLNEVIDQPLTLENGYILVPDRPGIGVEILEDKLARFPFQPRSIEGTFHADGSVAW
ncbi:MAG: mandelate racemase/muconate lactonizing enzyme family protein [Chloroflexi bacterium]|nr:mandelate racemase/muconate lactonizing enzyme family protein [Chloroflexota bacterium]